MFDALIRDHPHINIPQDQINFIKDLIRGRPQLTTDEKPFLFQIVANTENGLDVDKYVCTHIYDAGCNELALRRELCFRLDYIARDALNCGT